MDNVIKLLAHGFKLIENTFQFSKDFTENYNKGND